MRSKVVDDFWKAVHTHDWELIATTLADDFERIGMHGTEADTCRGKSKYLKFVSGVIGKFDNHTLEQKRTFASEDGKIIVAECIETIWPPGQEKLVMKFINILELNDAGLIKKLDIYWKTPPRMPPEWITPKAVLAEQDSLARH
jgi:hypothetical protein